MQRRTPLKQYTKSMEATNFLQTCQIINLNLENKKKQNFINALLVTRWTVLSVHNFTSSQLKVSCPRINQDRKATEFLQVVDFPA